MRGRARHAIGYNADETGRIARSEYAFGERIAFGFNVDEKNRINRSCEYNTLSREAFYPLLEWGWDRRTCIEYIRSVFGITWKKSACVYCPFNALRDDAIERQREHPHQVGDAMRMEHLSLALNPRGTIYKGRSLIQITIEAGNDVAVETVPQEHRVGGVGSVSRPPHLLRQRKSRPGSRKARRFRGPGQGTNGLEHDLG